MIASRMTARWIAALAVSSLAVACGGAPDDPPAENVATRSGELPGESGSFGLTSGAPSGGWGPCAGSGTPSLATDAANCGACGNACAEGLVCSQGQCGTSCVGTTLCQSAGGTDGGAGSPYCAATATDPNNCGACGNPCPGGPNATAACGGSLCELVCSPGFAHCDGVTAHGCEVDVTTDGSNCGTCGHVCPNGVACIAGSCCAPEGGCNAAAPSCAELTTYGTDSCGTACTRTFAGCCTDGSCSAAAPSCAELTTYGADNCGTACSKTFAGCCTDGSCNAAAPSCAELTTYGTDNCGTACSKTFAGCCTDNSCNAPAPACDQTTYGTDNCGNPCDKTGKSCPLILSCHDGCNGDLGYGDHCDPSDNAAGCPADEFQVWCNRRNQDFPGNPGAWDAWVQNWVASQCDGQLLDTGGQYDTWYCISSQNIEYKCTTPIVLVFEQGAAVRFTSTASSFAFTPGTPVSSDWPAAVTPWLVRDVNRNGQVDDGRELFGGDTLLSPGRTATHGFEALAPLDESGDGIVDARDPAFAELLLWSDRNGDKRSTPDELQTLPEAGVTSLTVQYTEVPRCDARGNCERERSTFRFTDAHGEGHTGALVDVWLKTSPDQPSAGGVCL